MRVTVRAFALLIGLLTVGAAVDPGFFPPSQSVAQGIGDEPVRVTATPFIPLVPIPTESALRCPDPAEPVAPELVRSAATPVALYQPVPYSTGEFVVVSNTNEHGANLRVAPRALARILRVVPEGEVLETVGGDLKVDHVVWAYVRDEDGTLGWIVSHMLTGVARVPGRGPLPWQTPAAVACATLPPTPTPAVIQVTPTPGPNDQAAPGAPGAPGSGGGDRSGGLVGERWDVSSTDDGALGMAR